MQQRRMAGRFFIVPFEVDDLVDDLPPGCWRVYKAILKHALIDEDWEADGMWVVGHFNMPKSVIKATTGLSDSHFYRSWAQLEGAGLIKGTDETGYELPKYKKKSDASISTAEVRRMASRILLLEEEVELMRHFIESPSDQREAVKIPSGGTEAGPQSNQRQPVKIPFKGTDRPGGGTDRPFKGSPSLKEDLEKKDLSLSGIVSLFYNRIGQKRISKKKRESAEEVFRKLGKDGFSPQDISFAVEWTLQNAKAEPYDFSIIEHTIGQAMAAREREEAKSKSTEEQEREAAEGRAEAERQEGEAEKIRSYKESLSDEDRRHLREQAEAEISASGQFKQEFITQVLIDVKENEILRTRMESGDGGSDAGAEKKI